MSTVLEKADELAAQGDRTAFNLAVWKKLLADPELAKLDHRIETDEHGQIIMSPPPAPSHGSKQSRIVRQLGRLIPTGEVITECPISTSRGVKAADVAWCSDRIWQETQQAICFVRCPEICVEVLSPSNTRSEIEEKKRLHFEAGAEEVWICDKNGAMRYFLREEPNRPCEHSARCPEYPDQVQ